MPDTPSNVPQWDIGAARAPAAIADLARPPGWRRSEDVTADAAAVDAVAETVAPDPLAPAAAAAAPPVPVVAPAITEAAPSEPAGDTAGVAEPVDATSTRRRRAAD